MEWERKAEEAIKQLPILVRPLVRGKVEERVRSRGGVRVTAADFAEAEARFRGVRAGKSDRELSEMMPQPNRAGAATVSVETCHGELSNCPHRIIAPSQWKQKLEDLIARNDYSERLRAKIKSDAILYHHKFHISISGCANGCSRPQIADFGLLGKTRPLVDPALCTGCLACVEACPDQAVRVDGQGPVFDWNRCLLCKDCSAACESGCIRMGETGVQVLIGGKLGRHPRLAETARELAGEAEVLALLETTLEKFLAEGGIEERFADYWAGKAGSFFQKLHPRGSGAERGDRFRLEGRP